MYRMPPSTESNKSCFSSSLNCDKDQRRYKQSMQVPKNELDAILELFDQRDTGGNSTCRCFMGVVVLGVLIMYFSHHVGWTGEGVLPLRDALELTRQVRESLRPTSEVKDGGTHLGGA